MRCLQLPQQPRRKHYSTRTWVNLPQLSSRTRSRRAYPSRVRNHRPPPRSRLRKQHQPTRPALPAPNPPPPAAPCLAPVVPLLLCHTNPAPVAHRGLPPDPADTCPRLLDADLRGSRLRDALIALHRYCVRRVESALRPVSRAAHLHPGADATGSPVRVGQHRRVLRPHQP